MIIHKDDKPVLDFIKPNWENGPWIAGGAVLDWYNSNPVASDIDVYFKNRKSFDKMVAPLKKSALELSLFTLQSDSQYNDIEIVFETKNAITLMYKNKFKIQLIQHKFYDAPQDVIKDFDISVCQLVTDGYKKIRFGEYTLPDIKNKSLRMVNLRVSCVPRLVKYIIYGYKPINGTFDDIINIPNLNEEFNNGWEDYEY